MGGMNIYQRIVLVRGGIGMAVVIYMAIEEGIYTEAKSLIRLITLTYSCILAIAYSAIVAALTFSAYIGFKSRK